MKKKVLTYLNKYKEIINYLIFGALTTLVSLIIKYSLLFTVLDAKNAIQLQIAIIISWIGAVTFAYITNRKYVFNSKNNNIIKEIVSFFTSRITTLLLEMLIMWFFVTILKLDSNTWVLIITLITQILVIIGNYILSKIFVFRKKI